MTDKLRILVVSRSYPAADDLYRYPFVHRRVLGYRVAGQEVAVFRPSEDESGSYGFEGVQCTVGGRAALETLAATFDPDVLAVHGLGPGMWPAVEPLARSLPFAAWLHGSEIPGFLERKSVIDGIPQQLARAQLDECQGFWRHLLAGPARPAKLVFPSETAVGYMTESVPVGIRSCAIIPNPIDTELFAYVPKAADQRFRILMIRPFDSRCYANDIAVRTICDLQDDGRGGDFEFRIFGDGPLFDETIAPLLGRPNITIYRRFLTQAEIAREHQLSGLFLVPTRLDTQGVSRDEAMSSGLVPVTSEIDPVVKFVDESCGVLSPSDDASAMAAAIRRVADDAELFAELSRAAARRVRASRSNQSVVGMDMSLLRAIADH